MNEKGHAEECHDDKDKRLREQVLDPELNRKSNGKKQKREGLVDVEKAGEKRAQDCG